MNSQNPAIQRRRLLQLGSLSALGTGGLLQAGCRDAECPPASPQATAGVYRYVETCLVANQARYQAKFVDAGFDNAWGIAIRPAGAGGHFWVGASGTNWQYVGDVQKSADAALRTLFQDGLKKVAVPGADALTSEASTGKATGVVYNGAELNSPNFRVSGQTAGSTAFDGLARFAFVTDSSKVSAWTDRSSSIRQRRRSGRQQRAVFRAWPEDEADGVFGSLRVAGLTYEAGGARTWRLCTRRERAVFAIKLIAACARITLARALLCLIRYVPQSAKNRHSREGGNPVHSCGSLRSSWIPAFAGMTDSWSEACI